MPDDCRTPRGRTNARRIARRAAVVALALALGGCSAMTLPAARPASGDNRILLTGIVAAPDDGPILLADCASRRRVVLGGMSVGSDHYLRRSIQSLARREGGPITAQISGYPRSTRQGLRLDRPALMWLSSRRCLEPEERSLDYN